MSRTLTLSVCKHMLLLVALLLLPLAAQAYVESNGLYYETSSTRSVTLIANPNGTRYSGRITIPVHFKKGNIEYTVTAIGDKAFYSCSGLTSIKIPQSVTSIGDLAFYDCSALTRVTMQDSHLTSIGVEAFRRCSSLTDITIPSSVTSIGGIAFDGCTQLKKVYITDLVAWCNIPFTDYATNPLYYARHLYLNGQEITDLVIPSSVTSIGDLTFERCSLTSVTIPNSVTSIGDRAFDRCSSLKSVTIPSSVISIGEWAFRECSSLKSVTIPSSVTSIGEWAFTSCYSLKSVTLNSNAIVSVDRRYDESICRIFGRQVQSYIIGGDVTSIGKNAFYDCESLASVTIHESVTSIGDDAFTRCSSLTSITIPGSVTSIGEWAFSYCSSLTSITIPGSVTSIGEQAFYDCTQLNSVYITDLAAWCNISFGSTPFSYARHLYLNGQEITDLVIPSSVTSIGAYAFFNCESFASVTIPESVTSIGSYAFSGCSALTSLTIPSNVTSIGAYAFRGCQGLKEIYCEAVTPPDSKGEPFTNVEKSKVLVVVPDGSEELYKAHPVWKDFWIETPTGISLTPDFSKGGGAIYNLSGQQLSKPARGINIVNGKKIIRL